MSSASRSWRYRASGPAIAELDTTELWAKLAESIHEAMDRSGGADRIGGIGATSQRTGIVLVDERGAVLHAGPNADGRGAGPGMELEREHRDDVYRTAGRLPVMLYLPARLAALRQSDPAVVERARWALSFGDWVVFRLSGVAATEPTQAAEMLVYDLAAGTWSEDLCSRLGVPSDLLPPIRSPGDVVGSLTGHTARELGLPADVPTVAGGSDTQAAALAMGVVRPGQAAVIAGSTMLCEQPVADPVIDEQERLWTSPHLSGGFVVEAHCGEAGVPLDWMAELMGENHGWIDQAAGKAEPGAGGLFFVDPAPSAVGDFPMLRTGGLTFPAPLLAMGRPREDVARAVLEGIAFAAAAGLEWTGDVAGDAEDVALSGGLARSTTFARILATATGKPIRVATNPNGSALGAAMLAAVGAGTHDTVAGAVDAMADRGDVAEREHAWTGVTAAAFAGWRERMQRMDESTMRVSHMIGSP